MTNGRSSQIAIYSRNYKLCTKKLFLQFQIILTQCNKRFRLFQKIIFNWLSKKRCSKFFKRGNFFAFNFKIIIQAVFPKVEDIF